MAQIIIEQRTVYRCPHCDRIYLSRSWAKHHEKHCYKNDDRVPYTGELHDENYPNSGHPKDILFAAIWDGSVWVELTAGQASCLAKWNAQDRLTEAQTWSCSWPTAARSRRENA